MSDQTNGTTHDATDAERPDASPADNVGQGDERGAEAGRPDTGTTEKPKRTPGSGPPVGAALCTII